MSRNLSDPSCAICSASAEDIVIEEAPRLGTREELGVYFHQLFANAHCSNCGALYLAWMVDAPSRYPRTRDDGRHFDLSFRHAFNDEPAAADLPSPEKLMELHVKEHLTAAKNLRQQAAKLIADAEEIEPSPRERISSEQCFARSISAELAAT